VFVAVAAEALIELPVELRGAWDTLPGLRQQLRRIGLMSDKGYAEAEIVLETRE
jgi:hypothetical protein